MSKNPLFWIVVLMAAFFFGQFVWSVTWPIQYSDWALSSGWPVLFVDHPGRMSIIILTFGVCVWLMDEIAKNGKYFQSPVFKAAILAVVAMIMAWWLRS